MIVEGGLGERGAECGFVDLDELHAFRRQIGAQQLGKRHRVGALVVRGLVELAGDNLLNVRRQPREGAAVGEDEVGVPHVAGEAAIFLHLIELGRSDDGQRILLALNNSGLQRRIELVEVDRRRTGAERLEEAGQDRGRGHPHLEPLEIIGGADLARRRG